ncbi:MAG: PTS sugar transporter subunit IIA [Planctomycetota bacterium]|nr:PTS sugar transporter subunit IIA [Planctomycetota bacterium]
MNLARVFDREATVLELLGGDRDHTILELLKVLEDQGHLNSRHRDEVLLALLKRERSSSTGIGRGIALPHIKTDYMDEIRGAIGISREGLDFDSQDGLRVHVVFLFLTPTWAVQQHLQLMSLLGRLIQNAGFLDQLRTAERQHDVHLLLQRAEHFIDPPASDPSSR